MPQESSRPNVLDCNNVRFTVDYVCSIVDGRRQIVLNRSDVQQIVLRYGYQAPRPVIQLLLGFVLLGFIFLPLYHVWRVFNYGGRFFGWEAFWGGFSAIGAWLIYDALKKGWYLDVRTADGHRKLAFTQGADPSQLLAFLERAKNDLCYPIQAVISKIENGV